MTTPKFPTCPVPVSPPAHRVSLAHGEGGRLTRRILRDTVLPRLASPFLAEMPDGAVLPPCSGGLVMTTDSFVVTPLFFPGGDIGSLAVWGTANDLAVSGAEPRWLSLACILEEGLDVSVLERVLDSVAAAAKVANITVVTGDTKVVPKGAADRLFLTTTGIGELRRTLPGPRQIQPGDRLLVTGPIGQHGFAVLTARESLGLEPAPRSDCAPLYPAVAALLDAGLPITAMRDATRGGVAAVLHEWADNCGHTLVLDAHRVPVSDEVRGVAELLGLDPIHSACEGTMVVCVPPDQVEQTLRVLRQVAVSAGAVECGEVRQRQIAPVAVRRALGTLVPVDEPAGAPLPRIC